MTDSMGRLSAFLSLVDPFGRLIPNCRRQVQLSLSKIYYVSPTLDKNVFFKRILPTKITLKSLHESCLSHFLK